LTVFVEARLTLEMGQTSILPAAVRYQTELAQNVSALKAAGVDADMTELHAVSEPLSALKTALASLKAALESDPGGEALAEATHAKDALLPAMAAVRSAADVLEAMVADDLWPLPTYQEMLYIL
jgi:glutamine synthetase